MKSVQGMIMVVVLLTVLRAPSEVDEDVHNFQH
jgi:hypothetical protein